MPDKYAGGDALNGQLELVVAARLPSRCTTNGAVAGLSAALSDLGLRVTDANLSLTRPQHAHTRGRTQAAPPFS